ncbi:MAG: hypothetical protein JWP75_498 [Frondihabitans sp.]|nr:hypothetical protein [Frondihabitans sp.]
MSAAVSSVMQDTDSAGFRVVGIEDDDLGETATTLLVLSIADARRGLHCCSKARVPIGADRATVVLKSCKSDEQTLIFRLPGTS